MKYKLATGLVLIIIAVLSVWRAEQFSAGFGLAVCVIVIFIIGGIFYSTYQSQLNQIESLNSQVNSLTAEIDRPQNQLNTLTAERDSLQREVNDLKTERDKLRSQVATLQSQIVDLQNRVNSLAAQVDMLKMQIESHMPTPKSPAKGYCVFCGAQMSNSPFCPKCGQCNV